MPLSTKVVLANASAAKPLPRIQLVSTLHTQGPQLPIGTLDGITGELHKTLVPRRWNLKLEKQLGKLRDENKDAGARFAAMVIATLYERVGGLAFDEAGPKDKHAWNKALMSISQMWFPDVLYAFVWLRRQVAGSEIDVNLACPFCGTVVTLRADIDTMDVTSVAKIEDAYWEYKLSDPITIRGKAVERLRMQPTRFSALENTPADAQDAGTMKSAIIWHSIKEVIGQEGIALTENELEDMSKRDIEMITDKIDSTSPGPDMSVSHTCLKPGCKREFTRALNWSYDNFFRNFGVQGAEMQ